MAIFEKIIDGLSATVWGLRRSLARDRLVANLKTMMTVAPLTVLVWVYAEQQQLVTSQPIPLRIAVRSTDPAHRMATLLQPADGTIEVTLQGSQIGIDRVKADLQQTMIDQPLEVDIGNSLPVGPRQPLVTLDQIKNNPIFNSFGVIALSCTPETLFIRVDALEDVDAPVQAPAETPGLIKAAFHPATVKMRGPITELEDLRRRGQLVALADFANEPALSQPGDHHNLTIHLIPQENITFLPNAVVADLTVGQADQTLDVTPVPVMVLAPKWLMDNYKFDYKEVLPDPVTLIGQPPQLALVDPHSPKLIAVVELTNTDALFHGPKPVTFEDKGLPPGVRVKADAVPRTVEIGVDPR